VINTDSIVNMNRLNKKICVCACMHACVCGGEWCISKHVTNLSKYVGSLNLEFNKSTFSYLTAPTLVCSTCSGVYHHKIELCTVHLQRSLNSKAGIQIFS